MSNHLLARDSIISPLTRIVVVGFGFGGFSFCREMKRELGYNGAQKVDILVISDRRYITFTPLLPELAASRLSAASVSANIENLAQELGFRFMLGKVDKIDLIARKISVEGTEIGYDIIVLATGSSDNFHGITISGENIVSLKNFEDAFLLEQKLLRSQISSDKPDKSYYQVAVIGGGQTGVETASFIAEKLKEVGATRYKDSRAVIVLEASDRILPRETEEISEISQRIMRNKGIEQLTKINIKNIEVSKIHLNSGEILYADTIIWAAGARPNTSLPGIHDAVRAEGNRILVDSNLEVIGIKRTYAIGDIAYVKDRNGKPLAENASVAVQEGKFLARHILNSVLGRKHRHRSGFRFRNFGHVIPLGRGSLFIGPKNSVLSGVLGRGIAWFIHFIELFTNDNRINFLRESMAHLVEITVTVRSDVLNPVTPV